MLGTVLDTGNTVVNETVRFFQPLHILEGIRYKYAVCHIIMVDMEIHKAGRRDKVCSGLHFK